jgi:hypothetical protein
MVCRKFPKAIAEKEVKGMSRAFGARFLLGFPNNRVNAAQVGTSPLPLDVRVSCRRRPRSENYLPSISPPAARSSSMSAGAAGCCTVVILVMQIIHDYQVGVRAQEDFIVCQQLNPKDVFLSSVVSKPSRAHSPKAGSSSHRCTQYFLLVFHSSVIQAVINDTVG